MPYLQHYLSLFKQTNTEYDLLLWDRSKNGKTLEKGNVVTIQRFCNETMLSKALSFSYWLKEIKKILACKHYDKIIILTTVPGVLLYSYLVRNYNERYILDFRDYTFEKYTWYLKRVQAVIEHSYFTSISSAGFKTFLGDSCKFRLAHNLPSNYLAMINNFQKIPHESIHIKYLGIIDYFDINKKLVEAGKNIENLTFYYIGRFLPGYNMKSYREEKQYENIITQGEYLEKDKVLYYEDCDLVNSVYENQSIISKHLVSNKLYDALLYKIPLLVAKNTYMAKLVQEKGIGFVFDPDNPGSLQEIINQFQHYDVSQFNKNVEIYLKEILVDWNQLNNEIINFIIK